MIDSHSRGVCCIKSSACSRKGEDKIGCWEGRRERERDDRGSLPPKPQRGGEEAKGKREGGVLETCHSLSSDSPKQTTKVNEAGQHAYTWSTASRMIKILIQTEQRQWELLEGHYKVVCYAHMQH